MNLAQLIAQQKGARSYDQLALDGGGSITSARLQQLATSSRFRTFPQPETIRAIARALRTTERAVVLASAASLGLDVTTDTTIADFLPARTRDLSDNDLRLIYDLVQSLLEKSEHGRDAVVVPWPAVADDRIQPASDDLLDLDQQAADAGPKRKKSITAAQDAAGEENQDPGGEGA